MKFIVILTHLSESVLCPQTYKNRLFAMKKPKFEVVIPGFDPHECAEAFNADWGTERPGEEPGYCNLIKSKEESSAKE